MKQRQRLNLKFSVADVDFITALAMRDRMAEEICTRAAQKLGTVSVQEIQRVCWDAGLKVRSDEKRRS